MGNPELPVPDGLLLRPFRGVRFTVDDPAKVTSPPYDLIAEGDVRALLDSHPNNVVRLILPCSSPPQSPEGHPHAPNPPDPSTTPSTASHHANPAATTDDEQSAAERPADSDKGESEAHGDVAVQPSADAHERSANERYCAARDTLLAWLDAKVLVADEQPALYVYEQHGPGVLQRGLIGDVALSDPARRIILPHEDIFPGPVADRLALMSTTQANLEPIFLLYDGGQGTATRLVDHVASTRPPLVTADTADGLRHRLWAITDPAEIDSVNADLRTRQALIADGHHRYATYRVLQRQEHAARAGQTPASTPWPAPTTPASRTPHAAPPQRPVTNATPDRDSATNAEPAQGPAISTEPSQMPGPAAASAPGAHPTEQHARGGEQARPTFGPWDFGLALLVDSTAYPPDLKAIHRVIPGLPLPEAAARAKGSWRVHDHATLDQGLAALQAAGEPAFLLAGEGGCHLLTNPDPIQLARAMPPDRSDRWNSLNISILSEFVLLKVWGMQDDQQAVRIVHHDPEAALQLALDTGGTAVILKPLAVDDVLAIAAGGERVPRKSTSFGPKPVTGLVLRTFATG
ncbi:DUF1015 domain-containing protein [Nonomuraea sp. NPDC050680]|uniref:DUF1015 domain-containing protein n=1 Tax=Nonomuraea sp. NPDC050680 TaxID=3154630 RepID=UPI0033DDA3EA